MGVKNFFKIVNKNMRADTGGEVIAQMGERTELGDLDNERVCFSRLC